MAFASCVGFSGPVAVGSRVCSLTLAGMAPVRGVTHVVHAGMGDGAVPGGALTVVGEGTSWGGGIFVAYTAPAGSRGDLLSARLVPSGAKATPGRRQAIIACRAAGLHDGDYSRFRSEKLSLPELVDFIARKTLFVLDRVDLPKPEGYVSDEIGAIWAGCEELVEELNERLISFHPAAIKLVGLHARIFTLLTFCSLEKDMRSYILGAPSSLEQITKESILNAMSNTVEIYKNLQKQPNKDICGPIQEGELTLSELLVILVKKTTLLVKEIPSILLPLNDTQSLPLSRFMSVPFSRELKDLQEICEVLSEKLGAKDIPDHVAVGTFLGLDGRIRHILSAVTECSYGGKIHLLESTLNSVFRSSLVTSMTDVEKCLMRYMKKETE